MSDEARSPFPQTICALWIIGFLIFFFGRDLSNNSDISRVHIWLNATDNLPSLVNPFDVTHASATGVDSGWHLLPQRWPFFRLAGMLWLTAALTGIALTRPLLKSVSLSRCERFVIQAGLGLSVQSLWTLLVGWTGQLSAASLMAPGAVSGLLLVLMRNRGKSGKTPPPPAFEPARRWMWIAAGLTMLPFVILLLLNGCTPPFDFDVREYHLQGPKEWFQAGEISFLEHNVYTSFPFLSEMLSLGGMVLANDWNDGALVGKVVLSGFQLLTTLCVFATAQRWFGTAAGLIAAVIYVSVPWTLRISLIAYAEGAVTFFLMASVMCGLVATTASDPAVRRNMSLITGLLAGSAMAAKYPGLVSVVVPIGVMLLWSRRRQRSQLLPTVLVFGIGVLMTVGPWLIRNTVDTGNPVYPLLYSVFGATDWSPDMDAKWKRAHSASGHSAADIPRDLLSVVADSDWTSGLLFGLAIPTLLLLRSHREARALWFMLAWMLVTWWAVTHRIDRFWIPIIPVMAVLSGACWTLFHGRFWRGLLILSLAVCSLYHLQFWRLPVLTGFQAGLLDMKIARQLPVRGDFQRLNSTLTQDDRLLMVGEAEVFDLSIPNAYNTVFDESLFEQWTADPGDDRGWSAKRRMKPVEEVRSELRRRGITHMYVNWLEILRYREDGSYGYTNYVSPERFRQLVQAGVLSPPRELSRMLWDDMKESNRSLVSAWPGAEDLMVDDTFDNRPRWSPIRLYQVLPESPQDDRLPKDR